MKRIGSSPKFELSLAVLIGIVVYFFIPELNFGTTSFCETLISKRATVAFTAIILFIAIIAYGMYFLEIRRLLHALDKFASIVRSKSLDDWEEEVDKLKLDKARSNPPFKTMVEQLRNACVSLAPFSLQSDGTLKHLFPKNNGLVLVKSPREYINEDVVYYGSLNVPYYQSVPGALTGLGILFTFVGLAAGVTLATQGLLPSQDDSAGIAPANIGLLLNSIGDLLEGAGQAFITSIFGLSTSIVFGVLMQLHENAIQEKLESLNHEVEQVIPPLTPELVALLTAEKAANQEGMVREFKDGWDHLSDRFVEKLSGRLEQNANAQTEALVQAINDLKGVTEQHLQKTTDSVNIQVTEAMAKFTEMLAESMEKMTASFDLSAQGVGKAVDGLEHALNETNSTMDNVSRTIELTLDQIMNRLQDIEARITQSSVSLEQNLAKMAEHVQVMTAAVETSGEKFQAAATEAAEAWGSHVETAGQGFSQHVDQTGEAFSTRLLDSIDQSSDTLTKAFESIAEDAEHFGGSLSSATQEQKALLAQYSEIRTALTDANQNLSSMLNECRATVELITSNHETFAATIGALLDKTSHNAQSMSESTTVSINQLNAGLAQVIDMQHKVCETSDNLHKLMTEGITNLATALTTMNDRVSENMLTMDRSLSEAIGSMSNALRDWTELQGDVSSTLKKNAAEFQNAIRLVAQHTQSVEKAIHRLETRQQETTAVAKK